MSGKPALDGHIHPDQADVVGHLAVVDVLHCETEYADGCPAVSTTFFNSGSHCVRLSRYDRQTVRDRPVFYEELGAFYSDLREGRGWGLRQAVTIAQNRKLKRLTKTVISELEQGRTKNPDPEVLRELADLYEVSYEALVSRFVEHWYGIDLHAKTQPFVDLLRLSEMEKRIAASEARLVLTQQAARHAVVALNAVAANTAIDQETESEVAAFLSRDRDARQLFLQQPPRTRRAGDTSATPATTGNTSGRGRRPQARESTGRAE